MTNERWLKWAIARYYRLHGCKVSMKPARAGNAMVDGVAVAPEGERIAIEVKSPSDDVIRGVGQCYEAVCAGYRQAVLVTTLRIAKRLRKRAFQRRGIKLIGFKRDLWVPSVLFVAVKDTEPELPVVDVA